MKQVLKKAFAIILTVVMLATVMNAAFLVNAESPQDVTALPLVLDEEQTVEITQEGQMVYFSFIPTESGRYAFTSSSDHDTRSYLYNKDFFELHSDDDGGSGSNFCLSYNLEAGVQYYYGARFYSDEKIGSFPVSLSKELAITDIDFEPINVIENYGGCVSEDDEYREYFRYTWWDSSYLKYTVTFEDGSTTTGSGTAFESQIGVGYSLSFSDNQSSANQWSVGTYTETITVLDFEKTVEINVVESPVKSIVVEPIELIKNYDGYTETDHDNDEVKYFRYSWWYSDYLKYTITLKDGTTLKGSGTDFYDENDIYYSVNYNDNQSSTNQWTVGNTYNPTIDVLGFETTVNIKIVESPVKSIVVEPIELIKNYDGYTETDHDNDEAEYFRYSWWNSNHLRYTITLKDGTTLKGSGTDFYDEKNDRYYYINYNDNQSSTNQWTVGNTYNPTIDVLGFETTAAVEIVETPVESISVKPIELTKNIDGYTETDYDNDEAKYFRYSWWYSEYFKYTITLKDGTTLTGSGTDFYDEKNDRNYSVNYNDNQSSTNQWTVGNTYYPTINVLGFETTVEIKIVEVPITEIELNKSYTVDASYGKKAIFSFVPEESGLYMFDSFAEGIDTYGHLYDANFTEIETNDDGGTGSNFSIVYNLEAGEQYYFAARLYSSDKEGSFPVVLSKAPVITNIAFNKTELIANDTAFGYYNDDEFVTEPFFYYNWQNYISYTVTINGDKVSGQGTSFEYKGKAYDITYSSDQYSEHWTVGNTYYPTISVLGYEATCPISIISTPVKSITLEPISLIEGLTGHYESTWDEESGQEVRWFYYNWKNAFSYKITMKDGTTYTGSERWITYKGNDYYIDLKDTQSYNNQWTAGKTYNLNLSVLGYETTLPVTVTDASIKSITATPVTLIENCDGYWEEDYEGDSFFHYFLPDCSFKVTFNNGTVGEVRNGQLNYQGAEYSVSYNLKDTQSKTNKWVVGKTYSVPVTVLGTSTSIKVKIVETPIKSISVKPIVMPANTSSLYFEPYYWDTTDNISITVNYKNGARETYDSFHNDSILYNDKFYSFQTSDDQFESEWLPGATYTATVTVLGFEAPIRVTISEHSVAQDNTVKYIIQNDNAIITGLLGSGESITLPETINGCPVVAVASLEGGEYTEVIIPDSVVSISPDMLINADGIEKLTIGAGVTALNSRTFQYADYLTEIIVSPDNREYTSVDGIVYDKALTRMIGVPNAKTTDHKAPDTVENVNVYFNGNYQFLLDLNDTGTGYITEDGVIYNADKTIVYSCLYTKEGSYTMPDSVKVIASQAFEGSNLTEVIISNNVSDISYYSFAGSPNLTKVVLPEGLKSISKGAFTNSENLTDVNLPSSLTVIDEQAFHCTGLTSVTIPAGVKKVSAQAFAWTNISELKLQEGLVEIGPCAFAAINISQIKLPNSVKTLGYGAFCETDIKKIDLGTGVEYIGDGAFGDSWLEEIHIPKNVKYIGSGAFSTTNLKNITFDEGLTTLPDYAFSNTDLTTIDIPESVTDIGYNCFANSKNLLTIDLPDNLEKLDGLAFNGTAWYEKQANGAVYIEKAFYNYKGEMPKNTKLTIKKGTKIIADYSLINETNLKTVILPDSVKTIGYGAFAHCTGLTDVYYTGSKADRDKLIVENENLELYNATWHYNYCEHSYQTITTKATTTKNGKIVKKCKNCGTVSSTTTIYYPKKIKLSTTEYTYNGKTKKPSVTVYNYKNGKISSSNYTVSYSNNKNVGKATVTIKFKGSKYSGSLKTTFVINPKETSVSKLTATKKGFKATIKKKSTQTTGYQIQYSTSKKFKSSSKITISSYKTTSRTIKGLKSKKTYYVRVRTYKTVKGKKYYSDWSKIKSVKTK